eukprot:CAMPEP_0198320248 /NCGR_PEP_ID=MMETSP1450-20131203/9218_1 /TAXON_ID=753684 ORGANISM="Madagascaria erythrocladiodes, Strain CCMP3234" /NCGR_SAMPLE_ID=MMETSP1450 /ASSEMBLY_ACC=CAM_ASM_001115 /LENGTH=512 /DNA_ID=CAMNT_0044023701 /DNA_START=428 /DNA_END=1966 /DNA_ORIENTATION=+
MTTLLLFTLTFLTADARYSSQPAMVGPYEFVSPDTGNLSNANRCAKLHNRHGPNGYRARWRPLNVDRPSRFWQTPTGPRDGFRPDPFDKNEDVWTYLAGERQVLLSFLSSQGVRKSIFAAMRCTLFIMIDNTGIEKDQRPNACMLVTLIGGQAHILAIDSPLPTISMGLPFTPLALGMTPYVGETIEATEWTPIAFEDAPAEWYEEKIKPTLTRPVELQMWTRNTTPSYRIKRDDFSKHETWRNLRNTRHYDEEQCRSWINFETESIVKGDSPELVAVTGPIQGGNICDLQSNLWDLLLWTAYERNASPNNPVFPLSTAEGVLLIVIPSVWELITAATLLLFRVFRQSSAPQGRRAKLTWTLIEIMTVLVTAGEFGLLVHSTLEQIEWQPCWIGRWAGPRALLEDFGNVTFFGGTEDTFYTFRSDNLVIECTENPGTDGKWAICVGIVLVGHFIVLGVHWIYFSSPKVAKSLDRLLSQSSEDRELRVIPQGEQHHVTKAESSSDCDKPQEAP